MMPMIVSGAFVLLLGATVVSASEIPDQGGEGAWTWNQNIASSEIGSGVTLTVVFSDEDNCDLAMLMVGGNTNITELGLTVDGQYYGRTEMTHAPGTAITGVVIGPSILAGIKNGHAAKVTTNVGSAPLSLSGSARAINAAYGNCRELTRPLAAAAPIPQPQSATVTKQFFGERVRPDGSEIFALGNVISVFNNIQDGDDVLLKELVREMEDAGIPFTSVLFMHNGGGDLDTAMKMGKFIRSKGANTAVGGYTMDDGGFSYCASACVFAFAGGVQRTVYLPAKVGMHQASFMDGSAGTMNDGQKIVAAAYEYLSQMGVDPAIVIEGSKKGPDEMWWLTAYEAKGYGLATRVTKPHEY